MGVGRGVVGWWTNPLQTLPQGQILTFDIEPDPELDNLAKIDHFAPLRPTVTNVKRVPLIKNFQMFSMFVLYFLKKKINLLQRKTSNLI